MNLNKIERLLKGAYMQNVSEKAWFNAIVNNDQAQVEKFIEQGIDVNIQDADGRTALHLAAEVGNVELIYLLWISKVNVHIKDNDGNNALHRAAAQRASRDSGMP